MKGFTIKKHRLRSRNNRRVQDLKVGAPIKPRPLSQKEQNHEVIKALEAKING